MKTRREIFVFTFFKTGTFLFLGLGLFLFVGLPAKAAIVDYLVINELSTAGATTYDDWVELYNPSVSDIDLTGWSIQKVTSGGTVTRTDLSGVVPAGGYFLIVRDHASTDSDLKSMKDLLADNFAIADSNALYLVNSNSSIDPDDPLEEYVDLIGWGGIIYGEGSSYPTNIGAEKSLSRKIAGDDTNNNSIDFEILDTPSPTNSGLNEGGDGDLNGDVLVTVYPNAEPVQSITANTASIIFQVNSDGNAIVAYGIDDTYGSTSALTVFTANTDVSVEISSLACNTTYHYQINAENTAGTDSDSTTDASFTTLPCGINIDNLTMTRSGARANDDYSEGWEWQFDITVWNESESELKMKFNAFSGEAELSAGNNMRYSVDNGATWIDILLDDTYPDLGADISSIDESTDTGRQVSILVQMKVPAGTLAGSYGSSYGILTE
jgi:Tfp pilus assembly protein PilV